MVRAGKAKAGERRLAAIDEAFGQLKGTPLGRVLGAGFAAESGQRS